MKLQLDLSLQDKVSSSNTGLQHHSMATCSIDFCDCKAQKGLLWSSYRTVLRLYDVIILTLVNSSCLFYINITYIFALILILDIRKCTLSDDFWLENIMFKEYLDLV